MHYTLSSATKFYMVVAACMLLFVAVVVKAGHVEAAPTTFIVTNIDDSGAGSLRAAIESANANGNPGDQDQITFNISGAGDKIIALESTLTITQSVSIDGLTQGDAVANTNNWPDQLNGTIRIGIDNTDSGSLVVEADNVTLSGMAIYGSPESDIVVSSADNFEMKGVYLNTDTSGLRGKRFLNLDGPTGVIIATHPALHIIGSSNAIIGGSSPEDRNIFAFCVQACIRIEGTEEELASNALIQGNYFGVAADGLGNMSSIAIPEYPSKAIELLFGADNATIGGYTTPSEGNTFFYISGFPVIAQDVDGLSVHGNRFNATKGITDIQVADIRLNGVTDSEIGKLDEPYSKNVFVGAAAGSLYSVLIGHSDETNMESQNISIAQNNFGVLEDDENVFSGAVGIGIVDSTSNVFIANNLMRGSDELAFFKQYPGVTVGVDAQKVSMVSNSIYAHTNSLGIDILDAPDAYGRNSNDELDLDEGANDLLNAPGYTYIAEDGGETAVDFTLDVPVGEYRIEFFSNTLPEPDGHGEGEVYLGYQDITHDGEGLQEFSTVLSGTGFTNLALTATEIDLSTPSGFGATSEFGGEGTPYVPPTPTGPVQDLAIRSYLLNPEDYEIGNTLNYRQTITNYGPDDFDISELNEVIPLTNMNVGFFISPANLTNATTDSDEFSCQYFGDGSASLFDPMLASHGTYGVTSCGYTGVGPRILAAGDSIEFTLSYTVTGDSEAMFGLYSFVKAVLNDPDATSGRLDPLGGGAELIDFLLSSPVNNFALATNTPADLSVEKTLITEGDIESGQQIQYRLTLKNNGASSFDVGQLDGSGNPFLNSLFLDILPPNLAYDSQDNPDFSCTWVGPGSAELAGPILQDHSDYSLLFCIYTGVDSVLASGEEVSIVMTATTLSTEESFTNHLLTFGNYSDPDYFSISSDMGAGRELITNALQKGYNNAVLSAYTSDSDTPGDGGGDGNGGSSNNGSAGSSNNGGNLSDTGARAMVLVPAIVLTVSLVSLVLLSRRKNYQIQQSQRKISLYIVSGLIVTSGIVLGYGLWPKDKANQTKVIYDASDKQQDPEEGLLNIPKDAKSLVCDALPAAKIETVLGAKTNGARVSIPTTTTKEGVVSACAYVVKDSEKSDVESVIITQRSFNSKETADKAYTTLVNISDSKRKTINENVFYNLGSGQLTTLNSSKLTTISVSRSGSEQLKDELFKQLYAMFSG